MLHPGQTTTGCTRSVPHQTTRYSNLYDPVGSLQKFIFRHPREGAQVLKANDVKIDPVQKGLSADYASIPGHVPVEYCEGHSPL